MEVRRGDGSVIAVEVAGEQGGAPVLLCHGLADSRLPARLFTQAARELGLRIMTPDRPGTGGTDPRRLGRLADWVEDAALVLDGLRAESAALLGISAGGPFAAACAARIPGRVRSLTLVCPLGPPGWPTRGMAPGPRRGEPVPGRGQPPPRHASAWQLPRRDQAGAGEHDVRCWPWRRGPAIATYAATAILSAGSTRRRTESNPATTWRAVYRFEDGGTRYPGRLRAGVARAGRRRRPSGLPGTPGPGGQGRARAGELS